MDSSRDQVNGEQALTYYPGGRIVRALLLADDAQQMTTLVIELGSNLGLELLEEALYDTDQTVFV